MDLALLLREILRGYRLSVRGLHGVTHWARVLENGLRLATATGADADVVTLFALFHDARRHNEYRDAGHGRRGADMALSLHGKLFQLPAPSLDLLITACSLHEEGHTEGDITVRTCWDADRLDLGRVGIRPVPHRLCTDEARRPEVIDWAYERAVARVEPDIVTGAWAVGKARWWHWWGLFG